MVKYLDDHLDPVFKALADPTRRAIVERLALGDTVVGDLAKPFDMSLPAITKHLNILETAGLLERQKRGRERRCTLVHAPLHQMSEWIEHYRGFWEQRLEKLAEVLETSANNTPEAPES